MLYMLWKSVSFHARYIISSFSFGVDLYIVTTVVQLLSIYRELDSSRNKSVESDERVTRGLHDDKILLNIILSNIRLVRYRKWATGI